MSRHLLALSLQRPRISHLTVFLIPVFALSACAPTGDSGSGADGGFVREVPEEVVAIAAPNQDLQSVRVLPDDGCYWYRHVGPVETTMLPLRAKDGRPICTRSQQDENITG